MFMQIHSIKLRARKQVLAEIKRGVTCHVGKIRFAWSGMMKPDDLIRSYHALGLALSGMSDHCQPLPQKYIFLNHTIICVALMQSIQRSDMHFCLWDIYQLFLLVSEFIWHMLKQNILLHNCNIWVPHQTMNGLWHKIHIQAFHVHVHHTLTDE